MISGTFCCTPTQGRGPKIVESQAHAFAAEFLMPRDENIDQLPRRIDWRRIHDLKRHWGVSLKALISRAKTQRHVGYVLPTCQPATLDVGPARA